MQHLPTLEVVRRAVRYAVCTRCNKRPHASDALGPTVARSCEPECTIFANLGQLAKIAHDDVHKQIAPIEQQMREMICVNCHACSTAGDYCDLRMERECPLSVYASNVVDLIGKILANKVPVH